MRTLFFRLFLGSGNLLSGVVALCIVASIALGCTCGKTLQDLAKNSNSSTGPSSSSSDEAMPSKDYLDAIIAETTADFNYAITLNDFSKMYAKASPEFRNTYTLDEFKNTFKAFVDKKGAVVPILAKTVTMDPQLSPEPHMRTEQGNDILVVNGKYLTKPIPMTFEYEYIKHDDKWQLLKLVVKLV